MHTYLVLLIVVLGDTYDQHDILIGGCASEAQALDKAIEYAENEGYTVDKTHESQHEVIRMCTGSGITNCDHCWDDCNWSELKALKCIRLYKNGTFFRPFGNRS